LPHLANGIGDREIQALRFLAGYRCRAIEQQREMNFAAGDDAS